MRATHQELEHVHHMLQFWKNTTSRSSSFSGSTTDTSYYDHPQNCLHESNTVINNAELMKGVIPKFGPATVQSPIAIVTSAETNVSIQSSLQPARSSFQPNFSKRNDRNKKPVKYPTPYVSINRRNTRHGPSGGPGILPPPR